ncbi:RNA polymerase sigma factor [Nonomuraea sp. NPDC049400]|uniref:RNA polymerase sigma factor n=1 Tax=Nonomuraea sp. NPDC049400 TaxID=3364352 RepID=UPI0037B5BE52
MTSEQLYIYEVKWARPAAEAAVPTAELVRDHPQGRGEDEAEIAASLADGPVHVDALLESLSTRKVVVMAEIAAFYDQEAKPLLGFLLKAGADAHLAADLVQASFEDAIRTWETISNPRAWLRTVATRKLWRSKDLKRSHEDPAGDLPDGEQLLPAGHRSQLLRPDAMLEFSDEKRRVMDHIATLPRLQRMVLAWHLDGYGTDEIATHLQTTPAAVRQNLTRARTALKQKLSGGGGA